ncbi:MAG: transcriptional regulator NrdR [Candidatus Improbicoccus pseudotrichonymphae]|uniref:Transcriptional repressor NrdR n=1 Tax=Candidatus Improbicoccus pseudotrichonymphae TaxID=3033792 RepID=A0AA48L143_9FIRM|nr:MAG: transcriptional regulator NrdR [Candidatus Improbicoccus pseudotrichonymphae]
MKCPLCKLLNSSKVLESRATDDGTRIRRRRECVSCLKRFTTYETVELTPMVVIKKDGSREIFDIEKVINGILKACHKRSVEVEKIYEISRNIEHIFQNMLVSEVNSYEIGEKVMAALKIIDEVAYVRFASIYRQFKDISDFVENLKKLE